jgi:hypothetical protein
MHLTKPRQQAIHASLLNVVNGMFVLESLKIRREMLGLVRANAGPGTKPKQAPPLHLQRLWRLLSGRTNRK